MVDLNFGLSADLDYYLDDAWPFDRTTSFGPSGGPYATFPGNPRGGAMLSALVPIVPAPPTPRPLKDNPGLAFLWGSLVGGLLMWEFGPNTGMRRK